MNRTALDTTSRTLLTLQIGSSIAWLILGLIGTVGNLLLVFVIVANKRCRSNFYLCQMHVALSDGLFSLANLATAIKRLYLVGRNQPETCAPSECLWLFIPILVLYKVSLAQAITIGFDRVLAISMPLKYSSFRLVYQQIANGIMWLIPSVILIWTPLVYMNPAELIPVCTLGQIWPNVVGDISAWMGICLDCISILLYIILLMALGKRIQQKKRSGQSMKELTGSPQFKGAVTSFMIFGVITVVGLSGQIFIVATDGYDGLTKAKIQPYGNAISLLGCDLAFLICVVRDGEILSSFKSILFSCSLHKTTAVHPMTRSTAASVSRL